MREKVERPSKAPYEYPDLHLESPAYEDEYLYTGKLTSHNFDYLFNVSSADFKEIEF